MVGGVGATDFISTTELVLFIMGRTAAGMAGLGAAAWSTDIDRITVAALGLDVSAGALLASLPTTLLKLDPKFTEPTVINWSLLAFSLACTRLGLVF